MSVDTDSWYPNLADPCDASKSNDCNEYNSYVNDDVREQQLKKDEEERIKAMKTMSFKEKVGHIDGGKNQFRLNGNVVDAREEWGERLNPEADVAEKLGALKVSYPGDVNKHCLYSNHKQKIRDALMKKLHILSRDECFTKAVCALKM